MKDIDENIIKNYNKLFINNLPVKTNDYVNEHIIKIHNQLYNDALAKYETAKKQNDPTFSLDNYKIIELKDKNYLYAPKILMINKRDFTKETVDLSNYWNNNYNKYILENTNIFNELLINEEDKKHIEIDEINYAKGKITFRNKFNNKKITININKIDFNVEYKNQLSNTFSYMLKNIY